MERNDVTVTLCTCRRGSLLLQQRCDTSCTSGVMDDVNVIFARNGPHGSMRIPLHGRVTSLRRRAQANTPAASCWLRRVLDDGGRRD